MPFQAARFSAVVSFTMLHHLTSPELQDRLLAEACRVLRPGGVFAGSDSTASFLFRLAHLGDTMVLVDPDRFASRLQAAGFTDASPASGTRPPRERPRPARGTLDGHPQSRSVHITPMIG
jgi:SAM-dependent methyltransferase